MSRRPPCLTQTVRLPRGSPRSQPHHLRQQRFARKYGHRGHRCQGSPRYPHRLPRTPTCLGQRRGRRPPYLRLLRPSTRRTRGSPSSLIPFVLAPLGTRGPLLAVVKIVLVRWTTILLGLFQRHSTGVTLRRWLPIAASNDR